MCPTPFHVCGVSQMQCHHRCPCLLLAVAAAVRNALAPAGITHSVVNMQGSDVLDCSAGTANWNQGGYDAGESVGFLGMDHNDCVTHQCL